MRHRFFILLATLLLTAFTAAAQSGSAGKENSIDRLVNSESTHGQSKFTSVVERDPRTREVIRVVKVRELSRGIDISSCEERFEAESRTGRFTHKVEEGNRHTLLLSVEGEAQNRIYMLQYTADWAMKARDGKVTIVIKMNKNIKESDK